MATITEQLLQSSYLQKVRRGVKSPGLVLRELNKQYHRRGGLRSENPNGVNIFSEDWDNLIILDACRYDMFREGVKLPGTLSHKYSKGSKTVEFLKANFEGKDLRDVVYITANPELYNHGIDTKLHSIQNIWKLDGWDKEYGTVLPETVNKYVKSAIEEYPHKRIVAHYLQPHYPFINSSTEFDKGHMDGGEEQYEFWWRMMCGEIDIQDQVIWDAYTSNLDAVIPHIEKLLEELPGRTVVTSDHGNMVGERATPIPVREYGHPEGIYTKELVKVPWHQYDNGPRRDIYKGDTVSDQGEIDEEIVQDRLKNLGYKS